jgi:hypothetical protein
MFARKLLDITLYIYIYIYIYTYIYILPVLFMSDFIQAWNILTNFSDSPTSNLIKYRVDALELLVRTDGHEK